MVPQRLGRQAEGEIVRLLGRFRSLTLPQIADVIGLSTAATKSHIRTLVEAQRVVPDRRVKPFQYRLRKEGDEDAEE